jgi:DNA-binding NtrC family response regulator
MPLHLQPKLLRLLQEREVTPVGASRPVPVDVRFIASTNRNLARMVADHRFRADLYHRLNIVRIEVPPLRNRPEDIGQLLDHYMATFSEHYAMPPRELSPRLRRVLIEYPWPGNVRELCAYVERLYAANLPPMPPSVFQWDDGYGTPSVNSAGPVPSTQMPIDRMPVVDNTPVCCSLAQAEAQAIRRAMESCGFNQSAASKMLAIHRSTLSRKLRDLGMDSRYHKH